MMILEDLLTAEVEQTVLVQPVRYIELTQGQVTMVSDRIYDYLMEWKWYAHQEGSTFYAYRKHISMHKVIIAAQTGEQVDHINGNGLDNRDENLRLCTHSQNFWNRGKLNTNMSGFKGVSWHKPSRQWQAGIQYNRQHIHLGYFDNPLDAAAAYNAAAIKYHGEFARLN
jgi:hypothetical protein